MLTILYHPEARRVGDRVVLGELRGRRGAEISRLAPSFATPGAGGGRSLDDPFLSRSPILLSAGAAPGDVRIRLGESPVELTADGEPVAGERQLSAAEVGRGVVLELAGRVVLLLHRLTESLPHAPEVPDLIGDSEVMTRVRLEIQRVSDLEVPVLLRGETGTGKELVARALHRASRRRDSTCLCVNMAAIAPSLATSELFGSAKGAFTGSVRPQAGYFQRADGGTLFMDEVGEASAEVQAMLLRVLETGEIQRVGSQEPQRVDVRLIAATDADLEAAIRAGDFREPLLHRLSGYEIHIPPLRQRRDDLGRLLFHFLRQELRGLGEEHRLDEGGDTPWMPASIVARLARHPWPGNVRQLRNVARHLVIASRGAERVQVGVQVERLLREVEAAPPELSSSGVAAVAVPERPKKAPPSTYRKPSEVSEEELLEALRANRWQLKPTAAQLGVSRPSLYAMIEKSKRVRKAGDLSRAEIVECHTACGGDLGAMAEQLEVSESGLRMRMTQLGIEA